MAEDMQYTDETIRDRLGLKMLEPEMAEQLLGSFYETLNGRIGNIAASRLTEEQMESIKQYENDGAADKIDELMASVLPDIEAVANEEAGKLLQEIEDNAAGMLKDL